MAEGGAGKKGDKNILCGEQDRKERREKLDDAGKRIQEKKIRFIRKSEEKKECAKRWGMV